MCDIEFDIISKPRHYNSHSSGIEAIEIKRHLSSDAGDAFKYVFRTELKNGRQDLEKALWYLKDGYRHRSSIFSPTWTNIEDQKLTKIWMCESGTRRDFFWMLKMGSWIGCEVAVEALIEEFDRAAG